MGSAPAVPSPRTPLAFVMIAFGNHYYRLLRKVGISVNTTVPISLFSPINNLFTSFTIPGSAVIALSVDNYTQLKNIGTRHFHQFANNYVQILIFIISDQQWEYQIFSLFFDATLSILLSKKISKNTTFCLIFQGIIKSKILLSSYFG